MIRLCFIAGLYVLCISSSVIAFTWRPAFLVRARQSAASQLYENIIDRSFVNENENELVIEMATPQPAIHELPLFDSLYISNDVDSASMHSISCQSLREISQCYSFSLSYLGDLVSKMGCEVPVDVDARVGDFLTGEQVHTLLEAVNSLDPFETNADYETLSLYELADDLGITAEKAMQICEKEDINLPFGMSTILHISVVEQFNKAVTFSTDTEHSSSTTSDKAI